jgi:hypothetical protein
MAWLRQQSGTVIDAEAMSSAAGTGHLDALRWLRDSRCPWSVRDAFMKAAAC